MTQSNQENPRKDNIKVINFKVAGSVGKYQMTVQEWDQIIRAGISHWPNRTKP